jgi:hypothetical protein
MRAVFPTAVPIMPFKVFISHSAKDDAEAETLLAALSEALKGGEFAPRVDRENLTFGQPWREKINTWLTYCDAAVLILSPKALKSPFVAYEVSVLSHRKSRNAKFTILPLLLGGLDFKNTEGSLLSPAQVMEIQPHFHRHDPNAPDATILKVIETLKGAKAEALPLDDRTLEVITLLKKADDNKFRKALEQLKVDLGPWDPVEDAYQSAAAKLMSVGIQSAAGAIEKMKGKWTPAEIAALYCLVASSWVDARSADVFRDVVFGDRARRSLALTARKPDLVELFGIRSLGQIPNDENQRWWIANVNAVFGEMAGDELAAKVRAGLCEVIGIDDADLEKTLAALLQAEANLPEKPVVVSMEAAAFPKELMTDLRAAFDGVTYFFLTGNYVTSSAVFESAGVEKIVPDLDPRDEDAYAQAYNKTFTWLLPTFKKENTRQ